MNLWYVAYSDEYVALPQLRGACYSVISKL